jgi:hypothetical protein
VKRKLGRAWTGKGRLADGYLTKKMAEAKLQELLTDARRGVVSAQKRTGVTFREAVAE